MRKLLKDDSNMLKTIDDIFKLVTQKGASDILFTSCVAPTIWVAGEMIITESEPMDPKQIEEIFLPLLTAKQTDMLQTIGDVDFAVGKYDVGRFRINIHRQRGTLSVTMRFIPHEIPDFERLRLPERIIDLARLPWGMVLVTGGSGAGKSTTLAAIIEFINCNYAYHIITLEDPIEYTFRHKHSLIEQREVGVDTLSFASALRHVVHQKPDVVLISEMRDLETISAALTAAETGHLVLATLHTTSAVQTINCIIDVFPAEQQRQARLQLSTTLQGVVCQSLLRDQLDGGMIPAVEIMMPTPAIRRVIRDNETHLLAGMIETGQSMGMQTMDMAISRLVADRHVTIEDALANAQDPEKMKRMLAA